MLEVSLNDVHALTFVMHHFYVSFNAPSRSDCSANIACSEQSHEILFRIHKG